MVIVAADTFQKVEDRKRKFSFAQIRSERLELLPAEHQQDDQQNEKQMFGSKKVHAGTPICIVGPVSPKTT